jgi:uncharacterized protein YcbX
MKLIAKVDSLWRYPVKSMRGEELNEAYVGFSGIYGDRVFAFKSSDSPAGFPYQTGREYNGMIQYRPRFRNTVEAAAPLNLAQAEEISPGLNPVHAEMKGLVVDVETPSGEILAVDDPTLLELLGGSDSLSLHQSNRSMTDCRPVSLFSIQTAQQLGEELGFEVDKRRFRANIYLDLLSSAGFGEDEFIGRSLRIGSKTTVSILERDPRCNMITIDPDTGEKNPEVLRKVARVHDGMAGIYGAVLVEGTVQRGDTVELLD